MSNSLVMLYVKTENESR